MNLLHAVTGRWALRVAANPTEWRYDELAELSDGINDELITRLPAGHAFALTVGATPQSVGALLTAVQSSRAVVLLPATLPPAEIGTALQDSRVSLLVQPRSALADPSSPEGWHRAAESDNFVYLCPEGLPAEQGLFASVGDGAVLCQLTSGSIGSSRLAIRSLTSMKSEVASVAHHLRLSPDDTVLVTSSLAHSYALCGGLLGSLISGARLAVAADVDEVTALATATRPTVIFGLATTYQTLMAKGARSALSRTRLALSAGAPLPSGLFDGFLAWCGIPIRQDYGTTETGTITLDLSEPAAPHTVGSPLRHLSVRLEPPLSGTLHPSEQGEILVRSEATARGYVERGKCMPCLDQGGWYRTGDTGSWDDEGRLRLGRRLRPPVMTTEGVVDLELVERVALALPGIEEAVALLQEDRNARGTIRLIVVAPRVTENELRTWCASRLTSREIPARIERRDTLPRSPAGKVLRKYL